MITGDQILAHLIGDYLLQSDWMAQNKRRSSIAAAVHAVCYTVPFLFVGLTFWQGQVYYQLNWLSLLVILVTHFFIDRFGLARYVVWAKNWIAPRYKSWKECQATGYGPDAPVWLSTWLLIIADNILHIAINGFALRFL